MANLKRIVKQILQKTGIALGGDRDIPKLCNRKLISQIGMEMHSFYYPQERKARSFDYLKNLINEAERRGLSSENVKGARDFLENLKKKQDENPDRQSVPDFIPDKTFFELARRRQSIRDFSEKEISKEEIYKILESAIQAPSSCNRQSWRFLVLNNKKSLSFISKIRRVAFLKNASAAVCVFVDDDLYANTKELEYTAYMDGTAAIMNILYAAESLGISCCWVNFGKLEISETNREEFNRFFKVKPNLRLISVVALGYGMQDVRKPKRESVEYYFLDTEK